MRKHKDDLEYTADQLRGHPGETDEQRVQASMTEEVAKAIHRLAEAQEEFNEIYRYANDVPSERK